MWSDEIFFTIKINVIIIIIIINIIFTIISDTFFLWESDWFFVGAGVNALLSISDGLDPYLSCRKMEKARLSRD